METRIAAMAFLALLIGSACAQELSINMEKEVFYPGDEIIIHIGLKNTMPVNVVWLVDYSYTHNEGLYSSRRVSEEVSLDANEEKVLERKSKVDDLMAPGDYTVSAVVWDNMERVATAEKPFRVSGTDEPLDIQPVVCKTPGCTEHSKVFLENEDIYLDYSPQIPDLKVNATLTYPDDSSEDVNLPLSIKAEKVGTYTLSIAASKQGFRPAQAATQFAVIHEHAETVEEKLICNHNLFCEPDRGENYENCPQDCSPGSADGYCDAREDGVCDPDCERTEDPDCTTATTVMETTTTSTIEQTPVTPTTTVTETTSELLATSTTTKPKETEEKPEGFMGLLPYVILLLFIAAAAFFVYSKSREKAIEKKRKEFLRWKEEQERLREK